MKRLDVGWISEPLTRFLVVFYSNHDFSIYMLYVNFGQLALIFLKKFSAREKALVKIKVYNYEKCPEMKIWA